MFHNAKIPWYIGPYLSQYQMFKAIIPFTGVVIMLNTVKTKHHSIAIPDLISADRILEAVCQLNNTIRQQSKPASMGKIVLNDLLREVLLGVKESSPPIKR